MLKVQVETPGKIVADLTNWKTYKNEDYGFEMKYPKDWDYAILEMSNNPIMFSNQDIIAKVKQSIANI